MAQLTLVLPFALPAPEFASDLARALDAPALAALLSRTSSHRVAPAHRAAPALPHELWLAHALGLPAGDEPAFAQAAMRGHGLQPAAGTWFIVNPAHIDIARTHLSMADLRSLGLEEADSRALFDAAKPSFTEAGYVLEYGDPTTWYMRADDWADMHTASPDAAVGMNLTDWMPSGPRALAYRKLQNEVQMAWFTHPTNAYREERRLPVVNGFWPWAGAQFPGATPRNLQSIATFETPSWLTALGTRQLASLHEITKPLPGDTLLTCGNLAAPAIAADLGGWVDQMQRLESALFAPVLAALMRGEIKELRLVLTNRGALAEFTTTALAQRKFWRRPTLDRLI